MSSTAIMTVVKMMENLPESTQSQIVDHLREYLADLEDEVLWDEQFARTQPRLIAAARKARHEIKSGKVQPSSLERVRGMLK